MKKTHGFHAWRRMRDLGPAWTLAFVDELPDDLYGFTDFDTKTITLREDLSFEERRCTIVHETTHVHRGPTSRCHVLTEEAEVDRLSARLLLPSVKDVADCMVFHHGNYELVAEDLWVDPWTLEVRLGSLRPGERRYYDLRLVDVTVQAVAGE